MNMTLWIPGSVGLLLLCLLLRSTHSLLSFENHRKKHPTTTLSSRFKESKSFPLQMSGLFGEQQSLEKRTIAAQSTAEWQIYIDQSKASLDRGGSATLDAFCGLAPPSSVEIIPAILPKSKKKGPWVRCISNIPGRNHMDVGNVDSIDKVYRILTKHLLVKNVRRDACDCLKWKYKGNSHLEGGKVSLAIDAYNKALANCIDDNSKQEGIILLLRASTYLQQARSHKQILQTAVQEWTLPDSRDLQGLMLEASAGGPERSGLANSILKKLQTDARRQQSELRKIQYRHGLYQYSLLHAAQDSLRATELLPDYATSWLRAGELLSELWKLKESRQYYEKALSLDESLEASLEPILQGLERRRELRERARATREWPEDSLRLALDVAG